MPGIFIFEIRGKLAIAIYLIVSLGMHQNNPECTQNSSFQTSYDLSVCSIRSETIHIFPSESYFKIY